MTPILPASLSIPPVIAPIAAPVAAPTGTPGGAAFASALTDAISQVEKFGNNADASINSFLSGEGEELHDVALKIQEASLSFDLFLQVRSKIISAYQSVMSMQV
jgi:flagellar hook-basal body complex protein FliE